MTTKRDTRRLAESNVAFLEQGLALLERIGDEVYQSGPPPFARGGIGAHLRHVIDHYECFLAGLETGRVDYDLRERDAELERDRGRALHRLGDLRGSFERLAQRDVERPLAVAMDCGEVELERSPRQAPARVSAVWSDSSVARELAFLVSHTVHHYALVGAMLRLQGIEPGRDFGVAPSTLTYERGQSLCAR